MGLEPTTLALGGPRATIAPTGRLLLVYGGWKDGRAYIAPVLGPGTYPALVDAAYRCKCGASGASYIRRLSGSAAGFVPINEGGSLRFVDFHAFAMRALDDSCGVERDV
jgi:hypothetical protein